MEKNKDEKSEIKAGEKFILSITENGFGKKTSHMIIELQIEVEKELLEL